MDVDLRNCQITKCCNNPIHISSLQNTLRRRPTCPLCRGNVNGEVSFNAIVPDTDDKEEEEEDVIPNVFDRLSVQEKRQGVLEQPEKHSESCRTSLYKTFCCYVFREKKKNPIFFKYLF